MAIDMVDFFDNAYKNFTKHHAEMAEDDRKSRLLQGMEGAAKVFYSSTDAELSNKKFNHLNSQLDTAHKLGANPDKVYDALFSNSFPKTLPENLNDDRSEIVRMRVELDKENLSSADKVKSSSRQALENFLDSKEGTKVYNDSKKELLNNIKQLRQNYPISHQKDLCIIL